MHDFGKKVMRIYLSNDMEPRVARGSIFLESGALHSSSRLLASHERIPNEAGPNILCHEQGDSCIDSDHVGVIPCLDGIEGVYKAILRPSRGVAVLDRSQNPHYRERQKRQRASGRRWRDGSINGSHGRWPAPDHVAIL